MAALNVKSVNYFARATDHMEEILDQIQRLIDKGFAYVTETGVYFEVAKFKDYGKLANRKIEELETHRIDIDSSKKALMILLYGKTERLKSLQANLYGILHGVKEDLVGILKTLQSLKSTLDLNTTFTAEVLI